MCHKALELPASRIAFLTCRDASPAEDVLLTVPHLQELGWDADILPWDSPDIDWSSYHAVIIRSSWDYIHRPICFLHTLRTIEHSAARLWNPYALIEWNVTKSYLKQLHHLGFTIIPTLWYHELEPGGLERGFNELARDEIVVKPNVSGGSFNTFRLHRDDAKGIQHAISALSSMPVQIQPFLATVLDPGEYSLIFFNSVFSHAVLKRPQDGEFRVQQEFGSTLTPVVPDSTMLALAQDVLKAAPERSLYARIDLVWLEGEGKWALMEVEFIEPSLYLDSDAASPRRFAEAIDEVLRTQV